MLWQDLHLRCEILEATAKAQREKGLEADANRIDNNARQRRNAQTVITAAYMAQGGHEEDLMSHLS